MFLLFVEPQMLDGSVSVPEVSGSLPPGVSGDGSVPFASGGVNVDAAVPSVGVDASAPSVSTDLPGESIRPKRRTDSRYDRDNTS